MKERGSFLHQVKSDLVSRRDELLQLIEEQSDKEGKNIGDIKDVADEVSSLTMDKLQNSIEEAEISELKLIDEALERIDKDAYGVCIECSHEIQVKRLEYFPYAARCIGCQEALEE
jgi:DnaK suppressor protein